jgi:hypothetical protein
MFTRDLADAAIEDDVEHAVLRLGSEMYSLALAIAANRADAEDA